MEENKEALPELKIIPEKKQRNATLDIMKGIAMILVLLIHMRTQEFLGYSLLMVFFYAVPVYFFISGYLLSSSAQKIKFSKYFIKRITGLLVPYVVFFVLSFLWKNTVYAYSVDGTFFSFDIDWLSLLKAFLLAGEYLGTIAIVPPPIWFLHALFFTSVLFYFITKIKSIGFQMVLLAFLAILTLPLQTSMQESPIWLLKMLPATLFFMLLGHLCKQFQERVIKKEEIEDEEGEKKQSWVSSIFAVPLFLVVLRFMQLGRGDLWSMTSPWYFFGAVAFIAVCYLVAKESKNRVLLFVGRNSLLYLGLHPLIFELPFMLNLPEYFIGLGFDGIAVYLAYFAVSFLAVSILVYIIVLIKNWLFSLKGRKKKETKLPVEETIE